MDESFKDSIGMKHIDDHITLIKIRLCSQIGKSRLDLTSRKFGAISVRWIYFRNIRYGPYGQNRVINVEDKNASLLVGNYIF